MTDPHEFLRSRRSIRRFIPDPVADSAIKRILATTTLAPSAHNCQPWRFVHVKDQAAKMRLAQALTQKMRTDMRAEGIPESEIDTRTTRSDRRINEAPVLLLLCRDTNAVRAETREETIMGIQSVAAAGLQLLLAAHAEGLGGNWICWPLYAQEVTRAALDLPETWEPQAMFFLGHTDETPVPRQRKPVHEVLITR